MADRNLDLHTVRVRDALKLGFPITCASCSHLHSAWETEAEDCGYTKTCAGPLFGKAFPDYLGPLKREAFSKLCLICGDRKVTHQVVAGKERLGLCHEHRTVFDKVHDLGTVRPLIIADRALEV